MVHTNRTTHAASRALFSSTRESKRNWFVEHK